MLPICVALIRKTSRFVAGKVATNGDAERFYGLYDGRSQYIATSRCCFLLYSAFFQTAEDIIPPPKFPRV